MHRLLLASVLTLVLAPYSLHATFWSFSLPTSSTGSFTAEETESGVLLRGSYERLANNFIRFSISSASGSDAPRVGSVKYAFEVPGFALFSQPLLTTETQIISSVIAGECPTHPISGLLTFSLWAAGTTNDVSSDRQPAFGRYTWTPSTNSLTITNLYNLRSYAPTTGFSSFSLSGTCENGEVTFTGPGDRGGVMYITSERGAFFRTNSGKAVFGMPQNQILNLASLNGSYAVFNYDNASSHTIHPVRITINSGAASGSSLENIDTSTASTSDTWSITGITINNPVNGVFTGDLQRSGSAATRLACNTYFRNRTVIFCAAQSTTDPSRPMNLAMVSDAPAYAGGTLDTYGFSGGTGYNTVDFLSGNDTALSSSLLSDGRLVLGGTVTIGSYNTVGIARLLPNGSLDTSFGTAGKAYYDFAPTTMHRSVEGLAVSADGSLYVTGYATQRNPFDVFVLKARPNGELDTTFDGDGIRFASLSYATSGRAIAVDSSQQVYVAGNFNNGTDTDVFVSRFQSNGTYATGYNRQGWGNYGVVGLSEQVTALALDQDNSPLVAGTVGNSLLIARYTTNGAVDTTFGSAGKIVSSLSGTDRTTPNAVLVQPDRKIVVAGFSYRVNENLEVLRYTSLGALDTSFGTAGRASVTFAPGSATTSVWNERLEAAAIQSDGKVIGFGRGWNGSNHDTLVVRFTSNGRLDTTFNGQGYILINQASTEIAYAGAIQADSKYVYAGARLNGTTYDFNVGRVWP